MDQIDKLLAGIEPVGSPPTPSHKPSNAMAINSIGDLLSQVKIDRVQQVQAETIQEDEKNQRLQQLKIQRQALSRSNATKWLAKLSSVSEEGRWFEEFACHYESRLEAALDYLEAIEEAESSN
jgi:hypothetical protein